MYASIRIDEAEPADVETIARRIEESFLPMVRRADGFQALYVVSDPETGRLATIGIFDSKTGADQSVELTRGWVQQVLADLLLDPETVTIGEVLVTGTK